MGWTGGCAGTRDRRRAACLPGGRTAGTLSRMRNALLVMAGLLLAGSSRPGTAPVIVSAYADGENLLFDAPIELNWDSLLPPALTRAALAGDRARRQQLFEKRSDFGLTEVLFPVALPSAVQRRFYYLLDSAGIREIRPSGLQGTARILWAGGSAEVGETRAFGSLRARVDSRGGFVFSTEQPATLKLEPSVRSADMLLAPEGGEYQGKGTPFREIIRQYQVTMTRPAADRWILVQWLADTAVVEAGCSYRFSLFNVSREPAMVASTDSGCDV